MAKKDGFKRYIDAGAAFTQMTRDRAEELVQELVKSGDLQRREVQGKVEELIERSRRTSESLMSLVRDEVATQMKAMGIGSVEDLARQVASLLGRSVAAAPAKKAAPKKAPAKKAAPKKAPAKKAAPKKAPAKKAAPKKAPAKKAAPKKAQATREGAPESAASSTARTAD